MDKGAWRATVHGVAKNQTWVHDWAHTQCWNYWPIWALSKFCILSDSFGGLIEYFGNAVGNCFSSCRGWWKVHHWQLYEYSDALARLETPALGTRLELIYPDDFFWLCVPSCSVMSNSLQPHGLSLPGSSVHGDSPGKNLQEWVAMPSSGGSSQPRDLIQVSLIAGGFFTVWATRKAFWLWAHLSYPQ